jgi:hypothetical protein
MDHATQLWMWGLSLLSAFAPVFTRPGWVRCVPWVTGMVLCWEEHPLTQILTALGLASRWRVLEHLAEYGAWDRGAVERHTLQGLAQERPARWGRYHPVAVDDTTRHRTSKPVWGTCTFHDASPRRPHRADTVRAHNWAVMGELRPGRPWTSLPHAARLSCRRGQLPAGETFQTTTTPAVTLVRHADAESGARIVGVLAGAYAVDTVVRPCLEPEGGQRRIELVTRRRADARVSHPVGARPRAQGRPPKWGARLAAPQHQVSWPVTWQASRAWGDGRMRRCQDTQRRCRWAGSGPQLPVPAFVVPMAGDEAPGFLVTSALDLSVAQAVAVFAARFRQEDAIRDHQQRLGMEAGRAWTQEPILRTFQVPWVALPLLRLLQAHRECAWGTGSWWLKPEWNRRTRQGAILDLRRLLWRYRPECSPFLVALEELEKIPQPLGLSSDFAGRAA